jgi:hypothetical protein
MKGASRWSGVVECERGGVITWRGDTLERTACHCWRTSPAEQQQLRAWQVPAAMASTKRGPSPSVAPRRSMPPRSHSTTAWQ